MSDQSAGQRQTVQEYATLKGMAMGHRNAVGNWLRMWGFLFPIAVVGLSRFYPEFVTLGTMVLVVAAVAGFVYLLRQWRLTDAQCRTKAAELNSFC